MVKKMIIGLTGIIGSGKSSVAKILGDEFGAVIIDADKLGHQALEIAKDVLRENFGDAILNNDGTLNRKSIATLVFNDDSALKTLQAITHPIIRKLFKEEVTKSSDDAFIVYDAPLLFEAGYSKKDFDYIIVVSAPIDECIKRASRRSSVSDTEIKKRLQQQWPLERKTALADFVINNDGDLNSLRRQVTECYRKIEKKRRSAGF